MGVWNSSKQTVHDIIPVFLLLSLLKDKARRSVRDHQSPKKSTYEP